MVLVVAGQVCLDQLEYRRLDVLKNKLEKVMEEVQCKRENKESCLVVFPELIGAWMILCDQPFSYSSRYSVLTMFWLILKDPFKFIKLMWKNVYYRHPNHTFSGMFTRTLFQLESRRMLNQYYSIFHDLSKNYNSWIVAGSSYFPRLDLDSSNKPQILLNNESSLYNTSLTFNCKGDIVNITYKTKPVQEELEFIDSGSISDLKSIHAPNIGNIGVLICADSWYPECLERMKVEDNLNEKLIIAVPTFISPIEKYEKPWNGYSGSTTPSYAIGDIGTISEQEAWRKYSLPGCINGFTNVIGVNTCYHGIIMGMDAGGNSIICDSNSILKSSHSSNVLENVLYSF